MAKSIVLAWHYARQSSDPDAQDLASDLAEILPAEKLESGLDEAEVEIFEQQLAAEIAKIAQRLEAAGEDVFGPLPPPSPESSESPPRPPEPPSKES